MAKVTKILSFHFAVLCTAPTFHGYLWLKLPTLKIVWTAFFMNRVGQQTKRTPNYRKDTESEVANDVGRSRNQEQRSM